MVSDLDVARFGHDERQRFLAGNHIAQGSLAHIHIAVGGHGLNKGFGHFAAVICGILYIE